MVTSRRDLLLALLLVLAASGALESVHAQGAQVELLGDGSQGTMGVPLLGTKGAPLVGRRLAAEIELGLPFAPGALFHSSSATSLLLPNFGATAYLNAPQVLAPIVLDATGSAFNLGALAPVDTSFSGADAYLQAAFLDPGATGGVSVTRGIGLRFGVAPTDFLFPIARQPVGSRINDHELFDFDGDGHLDIVTANAGDTDASVTIARSRGDGVFETRATIDLSFQAQSVCVADLHGDGTPDLIVTPTPWSLLDSVAIVPVSPDFTTGPVTNISLNLPLFSSPGFAVAADLNGNGLPDLLVSIIALNSPSIDWRGTEMVLLESTGTGSFGIPQTIVTGDGTNPAIAVDFNSDGVLDFATVNSVDATVSIHVGTGAGGFAPAVSLPAGVDPFSIGSWDLNNDLVPDLVVTKVATTAQTYNQSGGVGVLLGQGNATFAPFVSYLAGSGSRDCDVGDINGDNILDLVVANAGISLGDGAITVHHGVGDGTFHHREELRFAFEASSVCLADLNVDGTLDVTFGLQNGNGVCVLPGTGTGFEVPELLNIGDRPSDIALADVNRDGLPDLMILDEGPPPPQVGDKGDLVVLLGQNSGGFGVPIAYPARFAPRDMELGDINGDDVLDVVVADLNGISAQFGAADGSFSLPTTLIAVNQATSLELADVNADGAIDLAFIDYNAGQIASPYFVFLGDGLGSFTSQDTGSASIRPRDLRLIDANGDNILDLIVSVPTSHSVRIHVGIGDGTYQLPVEVIVSVPTGPLFPLPLRVEILDLNGDGHAEIIASLEGQNSVSIVPGLGNLVFGTPILLGEGSRHESLLIEDLDADGELDLILGNSQLGQFSIFHGRGNLDFATPVSHVVGSGSLAAVVTDMNDDGLLDIAMLTNAILSQPASLPRIDGNVALLFNRLLR